ncbi:MAG: PDZ domain-containing protein [Bacteroidales bacterium]|nr:PDZ domain-containing protein [Bacteroidales bacterium]
MKNTILIILATIFNLITCYSQVSIIEDANIGVKAKISADSQYLKITFCVHGSLADIAGLKAGDRIYKIDDKKISDLENPVSHLRNTVVPFVKLTVGRFGMTDFFDINIPQISIITNLDNYITEGNLFASVTRSRAKIRNLYIEFLHDAAKEMFNYKTYDFEFTSNEEPLQEKILFNKLESQLNELGMKRSLDKPDLLIIINFFSGQKEQYVPPQQIISTRIKNTYNWYWGVMPVPITTSATEEGYTKVTYLTTLNLKFLDANEIGISKTPPVVWSGSLSETATFNTLLSERCNDFFRLMLYQFPEVWRQNSKPYYPFQYAYTGLVYNKDDMRTIGDVIPGSPANKIGIKKGDIIQSIDGIPIPNRYNKYSNIAKDQGKINNNGFSYLIMFDGFYKNGEIKPEGTFLQFIIKRDGNLMSFSIAPEVRVVYLLQENF